MLFRFIKGRNIIEIFMILLLLSLIIIAELSDFNSSHSSHNFPGKNTHKSTILQTSIYNFFISLHSYGDKVPKTFLGRAVGVLWLFFACTLLASFGAIMTSSVTTETVSISGKKVIKLNDNDT